MWRKRRLICTIHNKKSIKQQIVSRIEEAAARRKTIDFIELTSAEDRELRAELGINPYTENRAMSAGRTERQIFGVRLVVEDEF